MAENRTGVIEASMRHRNIAVILSVMIMIVGVIALKKMPRNEFPQFTIRQGVIVGVYPGASSSEVEEQLTRVVENYIFGYQEVKKAKTYSYSREGMMYIFVELNDNVKNADQFWSKLKHGLTELKMQLPSGVLALIANSDFGDTSALLITLSSDTKSYKDLEEQLKKLEAECRKIPSTSKIKNYGLQKEKIFVNVKPELLNEYNIKSLSLLGSYQSNGMVSYAGKLEDGKNNLAIHFPPNFESEKDLADQIVYSDPNGNVVRLKNIASIERRFEKPDSYIKQNGKKTILLSLEMQPGNNIVEYGQEVDKAIEKFKKQCPDDIKVSKISELPKYVDDSVSNFMREFLIAIVAVVLVTMVLLPFRVASVAGITVPISVLITLAFLYFFGIELHTVSLASLILVLGMIVDNSIVVIDNHVEKMDHGLSPWDAAVKSAKELVVPIVTATLAIMASYIPLGFMIPGTAGEFMQAIPIVVSIALGVSVIIALLLVPYLNFVFIKQGIKNHSEKNQKKSFLEKLQKLFDISIEKAFKYPKMVMIISLALIGIAILIFKGLEQQLFPEMERNQFAVEVYLPTGSSVESTSKVVDSLERMLLNDKRVSNVTSFIGTSSPRFHTVYAPNMPASNVGQLLINTVSDKATREIVNDYSHTFCDNFANAHIKWKILAMQPSKYPIEIRVASDSIKDIRKVESQIKGILKNTKNIAWVNTDWDQKQQNIKVNLDTDKANRMGYSKGFVATSLMIALDGIPLTTIWEDDYPVDVMLTQENNDKDIKILENQYITSLSSFSSLPLRSFATFTPEWTEGTIAHRNGTRTLTIQVDNFPGEISDDIFKVIKPQIDALLLPEGTTINYGGDFEGQKEVFVPMGIALGVSILMIFIILLFQFKRHKVAILIMSAMLLTLPGAAIGLKLMNYPFSITAFIGITSLCGMVVRNGIILIDYARELREKEKLHVREAAIAAGKRRMRPIFLTSAAAAMGVVPMILSRSALWGPLGTVICFGLLISMVLTLYVLPLLHTYVYSDKPKRFGFWSVPAKPVTIILVIIGTILPSMLDAQELSLDSCKTLALNNNKKIAEASLEVAQYQQVKKNAFTNYFPKASAGAMALRSTDYLISGKIPEMNLPVYDGNPANLQNPSLFTYFPGMDLNMLDYMNVVNVVVAQPITTGGRIYNGNKLAALGVEISKQKKQLTEKEILEKTEEYYWNIIALQQKVKTLDNYRLLLDTLLQEVNVAFKAGLVQKSDVLKVQLKRNELDVNRLKLKNGIGLSKKALCQHIGIANNENLQISDNEKFTVIQKDFSSDTTNYVNQRIEIQMLTNTVKASQLQTKLATGEYLPQVSLGAVGFWFDAMDKSSSNMIGLINISVPISDWWGGSHKIKEHKLQTKQAENRLQETAELLELQISQTQNEVEEAYFQINIAQKSVEEAKENLKIINDNFKAGLLPTSDLLEAQALYQKSLDDLTEANCNYRIKMAKYQLVTGN